MPGVPNLRNREHYPALVIGTGIAGLTTAFTLAAAGIKVLLVTKAVDPADCNTSWAQGGIIYRGDGDTPDRLIADIIRAGAGISNESAVRFLAEEGPRVVEQLLLEEIHVPFSTTDEGELDLTQEGAHSLSRIIHAGDATGRAIETSLLNRVKSEPNITLATDVTAIDLLTTHHHPTDIQVRYRLTNECLGAYLLDNRTNEVYTVFADYTVLATGGVGQIYLHTTNTRNSLGDGVVMAHRGGARIMNAEYVQFHPTALADKKANHFLISEALRGEGARLRNQRGEYFMERYAPELKDLAPRDVVARAIVEEMTRNKEEFVYLDLANFYRGHQSIAERFPNIRKACLGDRRRHRERSDSGRSRRALFLRRRARESVRRNDAQPPLRDRRDVMLRSSRSEPPGIDVAARRTDVGLLRRAVDSRKARRPFVERITSGSSRLLVARRRHRTLSRLHRRLGARLEAAWKREPRGSRAHPAGLDDHPAHDLELRRHRAFVRTSQARRLRHAAPRLADSRSTTTSR